MTRLRVRALITTLENRLLSALFKPIYKVYERELLKQVSRGKMPEHVGIILDGNRRWAKEVGLSPWEGHRRGFLKAKEVLDWCLDLNIRYVTYYAFSTENFSRMPQEVEEIMDIAIEAFQEVIDSPRFEQKRVRFRAIGNLNQLPENVRRTISKAEERTRGYTGYGLNIAMGYGGRSEIVDAVKQMLKDVRSGRLSVDKIDENTFSDYLYTAGQPDPDLIIRTSGEERLSGFLLWQAAYSELYFCEVYWPAFRRIDFLRAVRTYQNRQRRFGR